MDFQEVTSRWRHRYYKCFPIEDLFGVVRHRLTPAERGVWYDLRACAGISEIPGTVCESASRAYPIPDLAALLSIQTALLQSTLKKVVELGLATEDTKGIHILGWDRRQSEYDRQKPYRQKGRPTEPDKYKKQKFGGLVQR